LVVWRNVRSVAFIVGAILLGAHSCGAFERFAFNGWMTAQPGTAPDKVATFGLQARDELERGVLLLVVAAGLLYVALKWLYRRPERK
jgi:hypothetical protein